MAKKLLSIEVRGNHKKWSFSFIGDPKHLDEWRADGLEIFEVENVIPAWIAAFGSGFVSAFCAFQDLFNLRNPFRK